MKKLTRIAFVFFLMQCTLGFSHSAANPIAQNRQSQQTTVLDDNSRPQEILAIPDEQSVKPGVNKKFVDPDLDVDSFVKRFEIESREVFVNRERILAACGIEKGDTVADVGAGTGLFTRMFSLEVGDDGWVYAVDIAPRFIEHINGEAEKHDLTNITGVLCAENSINLPPESSDVVFVCDTYHHFEYPKSTLASIRRAMKDEGHLIVIDFERIEGKSREWLLGHVRAGKETFRAEILDAGFILVEEIKINGFEENYFLKFKKH
ncbi:class I SAM-dependent methyltransferase [Mariniblastus sp.]|nr:class I SAM-dependent methyltransferase [Mariniblastus sp.]